jgi:hypothetical protein
MDPSRLPAYVERPGGQCHLQPFACDGTRMFGCFVKGDRATIQRTLVDPCLNTPRGRSASYYRVLGDHVMVTYAWIAHGSSKNPRQKNIGWLPEKTLTLWVPLVVVDSELRFQVAQRFVVFAPYIVVDNPWSMTSGREIYGFPKDEGPISIPKPERSRDELQREHARAEELRRQGSAGASDHDDAAHGGDRRRRGAGVEHARRGRAGARRVPADAVVADHPGPHLLEDLLNIVRNWEVPSVYLKQFRAAEDGTRACYQAIIEGPCRVTALNTGGRLGGTWSVTAVEYASHPLVSTLGLSSGTVPAEFPFWIDFSFEADDGYEVWRA